MTLITISQSLDESYSKHKIIPDVVDKFETQGLLTIEYNLEQVALGNTLAVARTQEKPVIQFTPNLPNQDGKVEDFGKDDKLILVLTDPDAPSNKDHKWSEYAHWLLTDLQLKSGKDDSSYILDFTTGSEKLEYQGPAPPPKTGKHRYVFLLYKQDPLIKEVSTPSDRPTWGTGVPSSGVRDWIAKNAPELKLLGVNFFYAENEDN
ncbi:PEBP-like protein [Suhomyces tanzawaensis NRRL Y-17324]|uniref:PEBP-like protein n=1 Tax=Suhomyces tanzawaensis NRRL Y-17324 TaxID=984487 RepID=A0A1E4SRZ1_9ASCO|nr:PEBP-like protein [Suhomyces tanzawaensis NRRL Y-17324]ODV82265.1 PEBP-like protein [Suhomyces tanzawaensis NRRL Y-17324]